MRSAVRATAILGSSSLISIVIGVISSRAYATLIGVDGLGLMALLSSGLALAVLVGDLGMSAAVVRSVAQCASRDDYEGASAFKIAAHHIVLVAGSSICAAMLLLHRTIERLFLHDSGHHFVDIACIALATIAALDAAVRVAFLNGFHRVSGLARVTVLGTAAGTTISVVCVYFLRARGIATGILAATAINWALTRILVDRELSPSRSRPPTDAIARARAALLRFGLPFTLSALAGTGLQLCVPFLILHILSRDAIGFYRAAATISVTYLGLLITAMSRDFYPRIAGAPRDAQVWTKILNDQHRLVLLIGIPLVAAMQLLAPVIVPVIFTNRFQLSIPVLEWQLIGDLVRLSSWTISYLILARSGSLVFLGCELVGGLAQLGASAVCMHHFGVVGTGIGFLVAYAIYWVTCSAVAWTTLTVRLSAANLGLVAGFAAFLIGSQWLCSTHPGWPTRIALYGPVLVISGSWSVRNLSRILRNRDPERSDDRALPPSAPSLPPA